MSRLSPKLETIRYLFAVSGNKCAFPGCQHRLLSDKGTFIGQVCHIEAANKGGQRFRPSQGEEDRRSAANLILLCYEHHRITDEEQEFTVARLKQIKKDHESQFIDHPFIVPENLLEKLFESIRTQLERLEWYAQSTNIMVQKMDENLSDLLNKLLHKDNIRESEIYRSQLEAIKELTKRAKFKTAIEMLLDFKERSWDKINEELKYEVLANLGCYYFDTHDRVNGCKYFIELENIEYRTADALSFLAIGYAVAGSFAKFDRVFEEGVNLDKEHINLWVAYIERYRHIKMASDILEVIPKNVAGANPITFNIASLLIVEGKREEGIAMLKKILASHGGDVIKEVDIKALVAIRLLQIFLDSVKRRDQVDFSLELKELEEAKLLLAEAWSVIEETELAKSKYYIVLNRGLISNIQGDIDLAILDFQKAFDLSKKFIAFKELIKALFSKENLSMIILLLDNARFDEELTDEENLELQLLKARARLLKNGIDDAIDSLKALLNRNLPTTYKVLLTELIKMYFDNGRFNEAMPLSEILVVEFPDYLTGHLLSGILFKSIGDNEKALEHYHQALGLLTAHTTVGEMIQLVHGLTELQLYEKAIPVFERMVNKNVVDDLSCGLIHCYYKFGDLQAALAIAENLYNLYPNNGYLVETISNIYEEVKVYDKAIAVIRDFLPKISGYEKDVFFLRVAQLYLFRNDTQNAKEMLLQIKEPEKFCMDDAFAFARLLIAVNEVDRGLMVSYLARNRFIHESEAHVKHVCVCAPVKRSQSELYPDIVKNECAVTVQTEAKELKTFLITGNVQESDNVLNPAHPFARVMMNKPVNSTFSIYQPGGEQETFLIVRIEDFYVHTVYQSLALLKHQFSGNNTSESFTFDPLDTIGSFEQVLRSANESKDLFESNLYNAYKRDGATLGSLAYSFKRNVVNQWYLMAQSHDVFLISHIQNELETISQTLESCRPVVLDITALLTCFIIAGESLIFTVNSNSFIVAQSTFDELVSHLKDLEDSAEDSILNVEYKDGEVIRQALSKNDIEERARLLREIIDWCKEKAAILIPRTLLEVKRNEREVNVSLLGECFYDSILLADEHDAVIMSTDENFKSFLRSRAKYPPFSVYQLVQHLVQQGKLYRSVYDNLSINLIRANHIFIPLTGEQLWSFFEASGFLLLKPFTVASKGLLVMKPLFAAHHLTKFLKKLYLQKELEPIKDKIVLYLLNELSERSDFQTLRQLVFTKIEEDFYLLPTERAHLINILVSMGGSF